MPCVFEGAYHDEVWGTPVKDTATLFAQLSLITQQCGVSWSIVWKKRHGYRDAFHGWDLERVAAMSDGELDALSDKEGPWAGRLLQNRKKLSAVVNNARVYRRIEEEEEGGLAGYLWSRVEGRADTINTCADVHCDAYRSTFGVTSTYSEALSRDLKSRGCRFIGSLTLQAFLLQNGLLNGHAPCCPKNPHSAAAKSAAEAPKAASGPSAAVAAATPVSKKRAPAAQPARTSKARRSSGRLAGRGSE